MKLTSHQKDLIKIVALAAIITLALGVRDDIQAFGSPLPYRPKPFESPVDEHVTAEDVADTAIPAEESAGYPWQIVECPANVPDNAICFADGTVWMEEN